MESPGDDSAELRDFYERMPYPTPLTNLDEHRELYRNPERRRALFHLMFPTERPQEKQEILIAGCGTSQAARYALREPAARITAIDVSETSLAHTRKLQEKYNLDNLTLHRLSLLDVKQLGQTFDSIVCTGVLHHLADPDAGLRCLRSVLKRDGAMQIMVYARFGRAGIYMIREYCQLLGIRATDRELQALGDALQSLPEDHPLAQLMYRSRDFRHAEALADALLHPRDRAYTVSEIFAWLDRCEMTFGRWTEQAPYLPQCGALATTPHAKRLSELPEQEQYAAVEVFRGTMTQHQLIAYRSDRMQERQPIRFSGEGWRSYVPIRVPWAVCVRDGIPAGTAAVLLNRAHKHRDLILKLNEAEYRVFDRIDGQRTAGEIAGSGGGDFFQRLWQYDQIVFDAS